MSKAARRIVADGIRCVPLTQEELQRFRFDQCCPDCGGTLREGPHGGLSVNWVCNRCGRVFNDNVFGVDRIVEEGRERPS
jgi:ribosomal protein L37AE/L43A